MAKKPVFDKTKNQGLDKALSIINAAFKESGTEVNFFNELGKDVTLRRFSSGSRELDRILGGGYPYGKIIEIFSEPSMGKTSLALHAVKSVQDEGRLPLFIDAEHAFDPSYAFNKHGIGVDPDKLLFSQPDSGEQAFEIMEKVLNSDADIGLIVVDSVDALVPQSVLDGNMGDSLPGIYARLMSQGLRKIKGLANRKDCTIIFLNQTRTNIGVMYGNPMTTSGGKALPFYASIRMQILTGDTVKDKQETTGFDRVVRTVKNKTAPPFQDATVPIKFGIGIDRNKEFINALISTEIIEKSGGWFKFGGETVFQGVANAQDWINAEPGRKDMLQDMLDNGELPMTEQEKSSEKTEVPDEE